MFPSDPISLGGAPGLWVSSCNRPYQPQAFSLDPLPWRVPIARQSGARDLYLFSLQQPDVSGRLVAILHRHLNIHQNKVEGLFLSGNGLFAVVDDSGVNPRVLEALL